MIQIIIKSYDTTLIKVEVTEEEGKKLIEQLKEKEESAEWIKES